MDAGRRSRALPPEVVPFPVEPEYRVGPDLHRLPSGAPHFVFDERWPHYLKCKLCLLERDAERCRVIAGPEDGLREALWQLAGLLTDEQPDRFGIEADRLVVRDLGVVLARSGEMTTCSASGVLDQATLARVHDHLRRLPPLSRLADTLALAVQEDLVLVAGPAGGDRAELLHVCLPSHWNPGDRRGASFARLHEPVPHNERLLKSANNLVSAMLGKGPFERSVWSLTTDSRLDQNPARRPEKAGLSGPNRGDSLDRWWLRAERQTTRALAEHALFTIRVFVAPLRNVLTPARAELLAKAVRSMDAELLRYKGLQQTREPLLSALDSFSQP